MSSSFSSNPARGRYHSGNIPLNVGDTVLIDIGVIVDHYRSDMTRVVFYKKAHPELERLYKINKKVCRIRTITQKVTLGQLYIIINLISNDKTYPLESNAFHTFKYTRLNSEQYE